MAGSERRSSRKALRTGTQPIGWVKLIAAGVLSVLIIADGTPPVHAAEIGRKSAEVTNFQLGRLLFKAGRFQDARNILDQAQPAGEEEQIERLFLLGLIEARLGLPREAARRFETILARRPELTRVRLELARVYHILGRDEKARFHFEASLADELSSSVETAVEGFLNRIDARKSWSMSLSAAVLPESNPVKRTVRKEVIIGGAPFRLSEDARQSSGVGILVSGGASFFPVISYDLRGVFATSAAAKLYRQSDWNDISVQGETGLAQLFDLGSVSGGVRLGQRWLGGDLFSREIGPWMRGRMRLSPASRIQLNLSAASRNHPEQHGQDGWRVNARPGLIYAFNARTSIETTLDLELIDAQEDRFGSRLAGVEITLSHAFEGGLSVSPSVSAHIRRYSGQNTLFQTTRRDRQVRFSVNALHRALQYEGFAPYIGYSFVWNQSNIPVNTYLNHGVILGISKKF